jgi:hypothetical protein
MSKILLAILTVAAFVYAGWLVFLRHPLPDLRQATGLRRRFRLATLLFAGLLGSHGCQYAPLCYLPAEPPPATAPAAPRNLSQTLKAAWRTLDPKQSDHFRKKLESAVDEGLVPQRTADMLAVAYNELSFHKQRTRSREPQPTCYDATILGGTMMTSRENALKQIELLEKAHASGAIDDQTARKAREALARELEMLFQAENLKPDQRAETEGQLIQQYDQGKIVPSGSAQDAARLIVEMEREP